MRIYLFLLVLVAPLAEAEWFTHEETRGLSLDAQSITSLHVMSRHGFVRITGDDAVEKIIVTATIKVPRSDESKAREIMADALTLSLVGENGVATLNGFFPDSIWRLGKGPSVNLTVRVPQHMNVSVDDGTGYIVIEDVHGDVSIRDGAGSIELDNVGGLVNVEDSSGWIDADSIRGDIHIKDRSGAISVSNVTGSVSIDDGSGYIDVSDISEDLIIIDNNSGRLQFSGIGGHVKTDT